MNKNYYLNLFVIVLSAISHIVNSQCVSNEANVYPFVYNGQNYEIVKENFSWGAAANCAVERGGFLAQIDSQEEQDSIFFHMNNAGITASNTIAPDGGNASYLWIGGNDLGMEGDWVWDGDNTGATAQFWQGTSSGSSVGGLYNNWGNEPDNWNNQDGLGLAFTDWPLGVAGQWNDVNDGNTLYYIIEYDNGGVGLNEIKAEPTLTIYPNPGKGVLTITIPEEFLTQSDARLIFYSATGELMKEVSLTSTTFQLNTASFPAGIYFINLRSSRLIEATTKVVIGSNH